MKKAIFQIQSNSNSELNINFLITTTQPQSQITNSNIKEFIETYDFSNIEDEDNFIKVLESEFKDIEFEIVETYFIEIL